MNKSNEIEDFESKESRIRRNKLLELLQIYCYRINYLYFECL